MTSSKHKYQCFLILVQSFSACTFSIIYALIVCNINFHQFRHTFFFWMSQTRSQNETAAKQNDIHNNKKPRVFSDEPPSANDTFFGALSQGLCADWLVCSAYCFFLAFDWLKPAVLFFLNWTVCLFVKESPIWNYPN